MPRSVREQHPQSLLSEMGRFVKQPGSPLRLLVCLRLVLPSTHRLTNSQVARRGKTKTPTVKSTLPSNNSSPRVESAKTGTSTWQVKWAYRVNAVRSHPCRSPFLLLFYARTLTGGQDSSTYYQRWVHRRSYYSGWRDREDYVDYY